MLSDDKIEEIVSKAHWKFTSIKNTFSNVVEEAIKEALALAEKSNHISIKEIFGMKSAYQEAVSNPFGNMHISKGLIVDMVDYIKNLESLAEKNRWKYPEKGEFPEDEEIVLIVLSGRKNCDMAIHDKQGKSFIEVVDHLHFPYGQVKAWTYAPTMEVADEP